jgi:Fe-S-cluster containining protein
MKTDQPNQSHAEMVPVTINEGFIFDCSPAVPCFNACCRDLNQYLAPYDILQLKNFLGIRSEEFLATYTTRHIGPETALPVVALRPRGGAQRECPFVTSSGCSVYPGRPSSCRIYPLARAVSRCRQTGRLTAHFALIHESHCRGFQQNRRQNVSQWLQDQQLGVYLEQNDRFLEIIGLKNQGPPGPLDLRSQHLFQLALYDIDTFRDHVLQKGLLADRHLPVETMERLATDDMALLAFGHQFVAENLF